MESTQLYAPGWRIAVQPRPLAIIRIRLRVRGKQLVGLRYYFHFVEDTELTDEASNFLQSL